MRYLARKHGLYPQTEQERTIAEQTESFLLDVSVLLLFGLSMFLSFYISSVRSFNLTFERPQTASKRFL